MATKTCTTCNIEKDIAQFSPNQGKCKSCRNIKRTQKYKETKEDTTKEHKSNKLKMKQEMARICEQWFEKNKDKPVKVFMIDRDLTFLFSEEQHREYLNIMSNNPCSFNTAILRIDAMWL